MTWAMKPYMVNRCATRRRMLQNSPEASTSEHSVRSASDAISPPPIRLDPRLPARRQLSKKYRALRLCTTSNRVPANTSNAIAMTKACRTPGSMDAGIPAKGLLVNMGGGF